MNRAAAKTQRVYRRLPLLSCNPVLWLILLVAVTLILHLTILGNPAEYVFDEKWYAADAGKILQRIGTFIPEHPPLGRLLIAGGMAVFGDNPVGWRITPVLFGTAAIVLLYLVCRALKVPPKYSVLVSFLFATENLRFVQSSIAMLDVFGLTFMLAAFYTYLKEKYMTSGVFLALSALSKFTGVFAIPVIGLHWLLTNRKRWLGFSFSLGIAPLVYLSLLPILLYIIWGRWYNPVTETITMLRINSWSTFAIIDADLLSRPWEWLLNYRIITYWVDPHYMAMISPSIWAVTIPAMLYMIYKTLKGSSIAAFSFSWFLGTYLLWIPISLITDRTSYVFYFLPTIGAVCLAVMVALYDISENTHRHKSALLRTISTWTIPVFVLLHLASFVYLSPVAYGWKLGACVILYVTMRLAFTPEQQDCKILSNLGYKFEQTKTE